MLGIQRNAMFGAMAYQWNAVVPVADTTAYRSDTYANDVYLALPFDETNQFNDVSPEINSGSTTATSTQGANSAITMADVLWNGAPSYGKSLENLATSNTASMTYTLSTSIPSASSGTYVIEGWFNADNATTNSNWAISSGDVGGRLLFGINNGSSFAFGNENNIGIGTGWHHLAIVCDSGTKRFYYDGIYKGAWLSSNTGFSTIHIGQFNAGDNNDFQGHIQDFRVTIGSNRGYTGTGTGTANFTLPGSIVETFAAAAAAAAPRTAKTVTASGDAQVSTAQSKFSGASLYSDGVTDYLTVTADPDFVMGSNDFTLEAWVRPASTGVGSGDQIISKWSGSNGYSFGLTYGTTSPKNNIRALINDTSGIRSFQVISNPLTEDAWNHVALVVESGTLALYANGNRIGTTSVTAFNDATNADVTISALSGGSYSPNHYQDEVRISNTARYTGSTYTVPSTAFTNDANTLLLLHCDGTTGSTTFTDDNAVAAPPAPPAPTPYTADGIVIPSSARLYGTIGTNNASSSQYQFTFSAWVKHDGTNFTYVWCGSNPYYAFAGGRVAIGATGFVQYYGYNGANNGWVTQIATADYAVPANTWTHIAIAFDNTSAFNNGVNAQIYVNGTSYTISNTRFNTNANLGFDLATDMSLHGRRVPSSVYSSGAMSYAQVWIDDTFVDLSTNIGSFIDVGTTKPVDMGTDGTMSGLAAPMIYHYGDTSTFYNNSGRTTGNNISYTFTADGGTITDTDTDS